MLPDPQSSGVGVESGGAAAGPFLICGSRQLFNPAPAPKKKCTCLLSYFHRSSFGHVASILSSMCRRNICYPVQIVKLSRLSGGNFCPESATLEFCWRCFSSQKIKFRFSYRYPNTYHIQNKIIKDVPDIREFFCRPAGRIPNTCFSGYPAGYYCRFLISKTFAEKLISDYS